jgi:ActR/RegA family two-component response regulator
MSALAMIPRLATERSTVLIVEDDAMFARLLRVFVELDGKGRFDVLQAASLEEAAATMATASGVSAILLDLTLPDGSGLDTVRRAQEFAGDAAIVVVTGHDNTDMALAAVAAGAQDYLVKGGLNGHVVIRSIDYAIVRRRLELERNRLIGELQVALGRVQTLEGILPICSKCKRIRTEAGKWEEVDAFVSKHSKAEFSHGICQPCAQSLYGDLALSEETFDGR